MNSPRHEPGRASAPLLYGLLYAYASLLVLVLLGSVTLTVSDMEEGSIDRVVYAFHAVSLLIGGAVSGRRKGEKGWAAGTLVGALYFVILVLVGFLGFDAPIGWQTLLTAAICAASGAVGGMLGVNLRR
jgi:putative membrane protein, TIGR04086 family/integral membrane protein, TIGR04097 family